eukprot:7296340-Alexandrium_andersonii.AAC.1
MARACTHAPVDTSNMIKTNTMGIGTRTSNHSDVRTKRFSSSCQEPPVFAPGAPRNNCWLKRLGVQMSTGAY